MSGVVSDREAALLRKQDVLARFGELVLHSGSLAKIMREGCRLAAEAVDAELALVLESQKDGRTLLAVTGHGWPPDMIDQMRLASAADLAVADALHTRGPATLHTEGAEAASIERPPAFASYLQDAGVRAVVNVPILGPGTEPSYGILQVASRQPRVFTDADATLLRCYANLIAASVQRTQTLTELEESEDHYRASVDLNPQIPWTADPQGNITGFSDRWLQFTGLSRREAMGTGWARATHREDLPALRAAWAHAIGTGTPFDVEARVRHQQAQGQAPGRSQGWRDGQGYRWLRVRASPRRDYRGQVVRWYGTAEDIQDRHDLESALRQWTETLEERVAERTRALELEQHERAAAEEKLRQSQKMEAVGQLTGGLAHDFNNLLTGITGSLELLQTRVTQGRTADLGRYIKGAMQSANRAAALTHRLLAFARRQTLDPKVIQPNHLVAEIEELLRRTVGPAIQVNTALLADAGTILCDPNQLENALLNLAINARDAMPAGGQLRIAVANARVDGRTAAHRDMPPGDYVVLAVTDTGTGMPPEVAARAFDPFFTTKPLGQGTGLGLSMIYGFVQQSGGQARIHTQEGLGTTVSLFLPRHHVAAAAEEGDPALPPRTEGHETVLVVDDEAVVRLLIVEALQDLGYTTLEAVDGAAGLRQVEQHPELDLLVTDVGLPGGMNGRQLADAARAHHPGLRVLFITGFADAAVVGGEALEPGMEVMTKPFALEALTARMRQMMAAGQ